MKVIYHSENIENLTEHSAVGLGNFDGLHVGHMALINTLVNEAKISNLKSVVYTFTKHPENILRKKLFTPLLTQVEKKIQLLSETSLSYIYFDEFNEELSRMKPETFVSEILVKRLKIKLAVAGFDYRFGYKGQGDVELLIKLGKVYGFRVIIIPPIKVGENIVSSTLIRQNVAKGNIDNVFRLLGRHYSISGKVKTGRQVGRRIGFPTANLIPEKYLILPGNGVYATRTELDGKLYGSVTNIGKNPTFDDVQTTTIETHILDFVGDLYGSDIEVFFIEKLRGEKKFASVEELTKQIHKDVCKAKEILGVDGEN